MQIEYRSSSSTKQNYIPMRNNSFVILSKTTVVGEFNSTNKTNMDNNSESLKTQHALSTKEKRALYMSRLRGPIDSEYRRIERENNARAMRKKRQENPSYRENERRQNRIHMAEIRRDNSEYRTREHIKNRHRMTLKRNTLSQHVSKLSTDHTPIHIDAIDNKIKTNTIDQGVLTSLYQTLENNLQAAHISFIPYHSSHSILPEIDSSQQISNINCKQKNEYDFLKQIDEFCRRQEVVPIFDHYSDNSAVRSHEYAS